MTEWCKSAEFGCECGKKDDEDCPLPHPNAAKPCACRFVLHNGWLLLNPETECGYHRSIRAAQYPCYLTQHTDLVCTKGCIDPENCSKYPASNRAKE